MTYHKPEIELLGEAVCIIHGRKWNVLIDGPNQDNGVVIVPVYELDE